MNRSISNNYRPGTQLFLIINHFVHEGSITQVEAAEVYKIRRLASRISELKDDGWKIGRSMKYDLAGQRYVRYSLESK